VTGASGSLAVPEKVRQRTTARRIRLPLLHSCPGGIRKSSIHSPWRRSNFAPTMASCNPDRLRGKGGDIDKLWRFCLHRCRETFRVAFAGFSFRHYELLYNAR